LVLFGLGAGAIAAAPTYAPTPRPIVNFGSCDKCKDNIYGKSVNIERDCGSMFRQKAAERWGKWRYSGENLCTKDSCCASNKKDCCEANGAVWAGYVCAFFVVLCGGFCYYNGLCSMDTEDTETQGNAVAPAPRAVPYVGPTSGRTRAASVPDGFPDDDWFISRCRPVPLI
jgi:hypothetical protein